MGWIKGMGCHLEGGWIVQTRFSRMLSSDDALLLRCGGPGLCSVMEAAAMYQSVSIAEGCRSLLSSGCAALFFDRVR
jgi:hypothetical protein